MKNILITSFVSLALLSGVVLIANKISDNSLFVGAFGDPFLSLQLATSPSSGKCLTTDGTNNAWSTTCGSASFAFPFTKLATNEQSTSTTIVFGNGLIASASSTLADFTFANATGTQATTTNFSSGVLNITDIATSTFSGSIQMQHPYSLTTHAIRGDASDGTRFLANNWVEVANFGVGNTTNSTFYGAVSIDGATRLATSLTGILKASSGSVSVATAGTDYLASMTFAFPFTKLVSNELATSTTFVLANGLISNASSTLSSLTATTTNLHISADSITLGSGVATYVSSTSQRSFVIASTTLDALGKSFNIASSTKKVFTAPSNFDLLYVGGQASSSGGVLIKFSDYTNNTNTCFFDTNYRECLITSNGSWLKREPVVYTVSAASTTPTDVTIDLYFRKTSD